MSSTVPIITIDGPTASGKGTIARLLAKQLGFHYLDSGALYRVAALHAMQSGLADADDEVLGVLARTLPVHFEGDAILLGGLPVADAIRQEAVGHLASRISAGKHLRAALLQRQLDFAKAPGLVADGRDMGTVVFPVAALKVFLTASVDERARRRFLQIAKQAQDAGLNQDANAVSLSALQAGIEERDRRDRERQQSPLRPAEGAWLLDSTSMSIDEVVSALVHRWQSLVG